MIKNVIRISEQSSCGSQRGVSLIHDERVVRVCVCWKGVELMLGGEGGERRGGCSRYMNVCVCVCRG